MKRVIIVLSSLRLLPFLWLEILFLFGRTAHLEFVLLVTGLPQPFCLDSLSPPAPTPVTVGKCISLGTLLSPLSRIPGTPASFIPKKKKKEWMLASFLPSGFIKKAEWQMRRLEGLGSDPSGRGKSLCPFKRWMTIWPGKDTHFTFPLVQD